MRKVAFVVLLVLALVQTVPGADLDTKTLGLFFEHASDSLEVFRAELSWIQQRPPLSDTDLATIYVSTEMLHLVELADDAFLNAFFFLPLLDDSCNCILPACRGLAHNIGFVCTFSAMMRHHLRPIRDSALCDTGHRAAAFLDTLTAVFRKVDWGPCLADLADHFRRADEVLRDMAQAQDSMATAMPDSNQ